MHEFFFLVGRKHDSTHNTCVLWFKKILPSPLPHLPPAPVPSTWVAFSSPCTSHSLVHPKAPAASPGTPHWGVIQKGHLHLGHVESNKGPQLLRSQSQIFVSLTISAHVKERCQLSCYTWMLSMGQSEESKNVTFNVDYM